MGQAGSLDTWILWECKQRSWEPRHPGSLGGVWDIGGESGVLGAWTPGFCADAPVWFPSPPQESLEEKRKRQKEERLARLFRLNEQHCALAPVYGTEVLRLCSLFPPTTHDPEAEAEPKAPGGGWRGAGYAHCYMAQMQRDPQRLAEYWQQAPALSRAILTPQQRIEQLEDIIER